LIGCDRVSRLRGILAIMLALYMDAVYISKGLP
jgi:hypothetical protein